MIVRDEAEHLAECLDWLGRAADEICVVDTGSLDETCEIARSRGAVLASSPWTDDFSQARNRALELCTREWILVVDADERLAPQDITALRALVQGPADRGYRFVTRNYTDDPALSDFHDCEPGDPMGRGFRGWFPSAKVRLFPNGHGVRFEGAVHELVNASLLRQGLLIADSPIPVHHYPLLRDPARIRRKQELYAALGRRKAAEHPDDPKVHLELGNQYIEMGAVEEAVRAYRQAVRLAPHDAAALRSLGAVLHLAGRPTEAERALELSLRLEPASPDAWRNLGVVRGGNGDWTAAAECFRRALSLNPSWSDGPRYLNVALERAGLSDGSPL